MASTSDFRCLATENAQKEYAHNLVIHLNYRSWVSKNSSTVEKKPPVNNFPNSPTNAIVSEQHMLQFSTPLEIIGSKQPRSSPQLQ